MWGHARNVDSLNLGQPMVADADLRPILKAAVLESFGFLPQRQKGLCGWELLRPARQGILGSRVFSASQLLKQKFKTQPGPQLGQQGCRWGGRGAS